MKHAKHSCAAQRLKRFYDYAACLKHACGVDSVSDYGAEAHGPGGLVFVLQVSRAYARFLEGVCGDPWAASKYFRWGQR